MDFYKKCFLQKMFLQKNVFYKFINIKCAEFFAEPPCFENKIIHSINNHIDNNPVEGYFNE